jgi:hypothetical protein
MYDQRFRITLIGCREYITPDGVPELLQGLLIDRCFQTFKCHDA